jgi:predicted ATP-dependent serine protease
MRWLAQHHDTTTTETRAATRPHRCAGCGVDTTNRGRCDWCLRWDAIEARAARTGRIWSERELGAAMRTEHSSHDSAVEERVHPGARILGVR